MSSVEMSTAIEFIPTAKSPRHGGWLSCTLAVPSKSTNKSSSKPKQPLLTSLSLNRKDDAMQGRKRPLVGPIRVPEPNQPCYTSAFNSHLGPTSLSFSRPRNQNQKHSFHVFNTPNLIIPRRTCFRCRIEFRSRFSVFTARLLFYQESVCRSTLSTTKIFRKFSYCS